MSAGLNAAVNDHETTDVEHTRQENEHLLSEIEEFCNREDRANVENILLLGKVGAGKSSIVNTIFKAMSGKYFPKAKAGKGLSTKTICLERFKSCGVAKEDIAEHRSLVKGILHRLPTIFDFSGIEDNDSEEIQEILELLLGGFIQPKTSLEALKSLQKEHYVGALKESIYTVSRPEWKITHVVYVHSCRETAAGSLIQCLHKVLNTVDPKTAQLIYTGDVHVVMTKYDLVKQHGQYDSADNETISAENYKDVVKDIAAAFSIEGSLKDNMTQWTSYTDKTSSEFDNPLIDNTALKLMRRIVAPSCPRIEETKAVVTTVTKMNLMFKKWLRKQNFTFTQLLLMTVLLFLAIIMFVLIKYPLF